MDGEINLCAGEGPFGLDLLSDMTPREREEMMKLVAYAKTTLRDNRAARIELLTNIGNFIGDAVDEISLLYHNNMNGGWDPELWDQISKWQSRLESMRQEIADEVGQCETELSTNEFRHSGS